MKNEEWGNIKKYAFILMTATVLLYSGCMSLMEKTGKVLDGSAFAEKKLARYRARVKEGAEFDMEIRHAQNKAGERLLVVSQGRFPAVQLRVTEPNSEHTFYASSVDYVSGNTAGWNQYKLELSGTGSCVLNETSAVFSLNSDIEKVQIMQGKIRLYDTTVTGSDAVNNLRNREDRIEELAEWMRNREDSPKGLDRKAFQNFWKPVLFPEICPKSKRPNGWQLPDDTYKRAEEIKWNTGYTQRVFPEILQPVRDSGTLLRDWEEAFEWIYLQYEWETFIGMFSREITLKKVK